MQPTPERPQPIRLYQELAPYRVPHSPAPIDLKLDANEGAPPGVDLLGGLGQLTSDLLRCYPSTSALEARLAERFGLTAEGVLVTSGSDDALGRLLAAYLEPGREFILPEPSFEMLPRYSAQAGGCLVSIPWLNGAYPLEAVLARITPATAVIALVSPNNPTGLVATGEDLRRLGAAAPHALLLVDLAYEEFADEPLTSVALSLPNAIVTRTFSKAWGLASLRVGYALGPPELIRPLQAVGHPYPVSTLSLRLVEERLTRQEDQVMRSVARVREERRGLTELLWDLGAEPLPSQANFVLARFARAGWVCEALAGLGVAVRLFPGRPELSDQLRITCPSDEHGFARLTHALRSALQPQALLFDMDGVLADVSGSYRAAIAETAANYGVPLTPAEIQAAKNQPDSNNDWNVTERLLRQRGVRVPLPEVIAAFERLYQNGLWQHERLIPQRIQLERLAAKLPLAVVTGRPRADALRFLEKERVSGLFQTVVSLEDEPPKPDPRPVLLALGRLKVERAWMLGDTPDDVQAARLARVVPLGILPPGVSPDSRGSALLRAGAARVLDNWNELEGLLP